MCMAIGEEIWISEGLHIGGDTSPTRRNKIGDLHTLGMIDFGGLGLLFSGTPIAAAENNRTLTKSIVSKSISESRYKFQILSNITCSSLVILQPSIGYLRLFLLVFVCV